MNSFLLFLYFSSSYFFPHIQTQPPSQCSITIFFSLESKFLKVSNVPNQVDGILFALGNRFKDTHFIITNHSNLPFKEDN